MKVNRTIQRRRDARARRSAEGLDNRLRGAAYRIQSQEHLEQILADVAPGMRSAVFSRIRPYLCFQVK